MLQKIDKYSMFFYQYWSMSQVCQLRFNERAIIYQILWRLQISSAYIRKKDKTSKYSMFVFSIELHARCAN